MESIDDPRADFTSASPHPRSTPSADVPDDPAQWPRLPQD